MKQTPLLMIEDMVSKTLADLKTITRRIANPQPPEGMKIEACAYCNSGWSYKVHDSGRCECKQIRCPYGQPGDRLWIKETYYRYGKWIKNGLSKTGRQKWTFKPLTKEVKRFDDAPVKLTKGRGKGWHKRPSIFMPKWAGRLTLEIVSIRAERLQDITAADVISEGIDPSDIPGIGSDSSLIDAFRRLWDSINAERQGGAYAWDKNPWVWVIEFRKVEQ